MPEPTLPASRDLRLILGLKLKNLRLERRCSLRVIAERAGMSTSYLSELEQGKKYPKPEMLLRLAGALGVPYDELVSSQVTDELGPLKEAVSSGLLREFPFELFGLEREHLVRLISDAPQKAGALIRTLVEVGRRYDVQVEHFLLSALRSYQQMHLNFFEELETAASEFRRRCGWSTDSPIVEESLAARLRRDWGYAIELDALSSHPDLAGFRSVFVDEDRLTLHVNARLLPSQRAFVLAREIGYRVLDLAERAAASPPLRVDSFVELLNNFKASYFAGALLMDRQALEAELRALFDREAWDAGAFLAAMVRFGATPEMFLYRLTELVPRCFGLRRIFFLRFHQRADRDGPALTKIFNLSGVPVPYGLGLKEQYCRRWPGVRMLAPGEPREPRRWPQIAAQRSRFVGHEAGFFVISLARPLLLDPGRRTSVTIGFLLDSRFRRTVRFWNDPRVEEVDVHLTCERCPLSPDDCGDRAAAPHIFQRHQDQERKEQAVAELRRGA